MCKSNWVPFPQGWTFNKFLKPPPCKNHGHIASGNFAGKLWWWLLSIISTFLLERLIRQTAKMFDLLKSTAKIHLPNPSVSIFTNQMDFLIKRLVTHRPSNGLSHGFPRSMKQISCCEKLKYNANRKKQRETTLLALHFPWNPHVWYTYLHVTSKSTKCAYTLPEYNSTWKWMVGVPISFWGPAYFRCYVSLRREDNSLRLIKINK